MFVKNHHTWYKNKDTHEETSFYLLTSPEHLIPAINLWDGYYFYILQLRKSKAQVDQVYYPRSHCYLSDKILFLSFYKTLHSPPDKRHPLLSNPCFSSSSMVLLSSYSWEYIFIILCKALFQKIFWMSRTKKRNVKKSNRLSGREKWIITTPKQGGKKWPQ